MKPIGLLNLSLFSTMIYSLYITNIPNIQILQIRYATQLQGQSKNHWIHSYLRIFTKARIIRTQFPSELRNFYRISQNVTQKTEKEKKKMGTIQKDIQKNFDNCMRNHPGKKYAIIADMQSL